MADGAELLGRAIATYRFDDARRVAQDIASEHQGSHDDASSVLGAFVSVEARYHDTMYVGEALSTLHSAMDSLRDLASALRTSDPALTPLLDALVSVLTARRTMAAMYQALSTGRDMRKARALHVSAAQEATLVEQHPSVAPLSANLRSEIVVVEAVLAADDAIADGRLREAAMWVCKAKAALRAWGHRVGQPVASLGAVTAELDPSTESHGLEAAKGRLPWLARRAPADQSSDFRQSVELGLPNAQRLPWLLQWLHTWVAAEAGKAALFCMAARCALAAGAGVGAQDGGRSAPVPQPLELSAATPAGRDACGGDEPRPEHIPPYAMGAGATRASTGSLGRPACSPGYGSGATGLMRSPPSAATGAALPAGRGVAPGPGQLPALDLHRMAETFCTTGGGSFVSLVLHASACSAAAGPGKADAVARELDARRVPGGRCPHAEAEPPLQSPSGPEATADTEGGVSSLTGVRGWSAPYAHPAMDGKVWATMPSVLSLLMDKLQGNEDAPAGGETWFDSEHLKGRSVRWTVPVEAHHSQGPLAHAMTAASGTIRKMAGDAVGADVDTARLPVPIGPGDRATTVTESLGRPRAAKPARKSPDDVVHLYSYTQLARNLFLVTLTRQYGSNELQATRDRDSAAGFAQRFAAAFRLQGTLDALAWRS